MPRRTKDNGSHRRSRQGRAKPGNGVAGTEKEGKKHLAFVGKTRQRKGRQGKGGIERARQGNVGIDTAMEERARQGKGRKGIVGKARMVGKAKARNGR